MYTTNTRTLLFFLLASVTPNGRFTYSLERDVSFQCWFRIFTWIKDLPHHLLKLQCCYFSVYLWWQFGALLLMLRTGWKLCHVTLILWRHDMIIVSFLVPQSYINIVNVEIKYIYYCLEIKGKWITIIVHTDKK